MKKYIVIVVIFLLVIAGILGYRFLKNDTKDDTVQTVRLNEVTRSVFYAPQYVALQKGFFAEEGLNVELTTGGGADTVMTAILANQCDIGLAGPEASIYVYNEGKEDYPQVFAQLTQKDGSFLVSKTEDTDFSWDHLKGKTVIPGRKGGVPFMTLEYVLKKNGLDPQKDVVLDDSIKFDLMAGAFAGGNADYVTLFEPTASMTQNSGNGYIVASVGEASGEIPYTAYFAKKSYLTDKKDVVQKFTNAIYKAQNWVKEHSSEEIAESIASYFPNTDLELLSSVVQRYKDIDAWKTDPLLQSESFDLLQTVIQEAGELKQKAPYEALVNTNFATEAMK